MKHIILAGDSVFDNRKYVNDGEPDVRDQLADLLDDGDKATLIAVDGDMNNNVLKQLDNIPNNATHLFISIGGNDALMHIDAFKESVSTIGEALDSLNEKVQEFERDYIKMLTNVLKHRLKTTVCTIYNPHFEHSSLDKIITMLPNNFNLKSGWKKPKKIVDQLDWHANLPKVALNDSGKALVIWDRFNKSDQRDIWSIDFDPKNSWGKVVSLESIPGSAAGTMVKLDSKGRGLSFWWQYDQTNKRSIYSSTYLPSKGWGKPTLLENFSGHSGDGCIDLNESGKAVAVWWQRNPQMKDLVGASFSFVKGWGKAKLLEQNNAGDVNYFPKVSINDQGAALSAWQQSDGIRDHVWANRFF